MSNWLEKHKHNDSSEKNSTSTKICDTVAETGTITRKMSTDEDILNTVHEMFGPTVRIVDCEKSSSLQQEETLMINGVPIKLDGMEGDDAAAIKNALLDGQMPSVELLNQLLYQAGLLRQPIQLETTLSVKSSLVTMEEVSVSKQGQVLDERTCETKEDYIYQSNQKEILHPTVGCGLTDLPMKMVDDCKTFTRKETTEKQNSRKSPQKSATFTCMPNSLSRDNSRTSHKVLHSDVSMDSSECGDTESTVSDWSSNTFSKNVARTNSRISSSSVLTATTQPMNSTSTNVVSCNGNRSSVSCDSGHDGVYHSVSQSTAFTPWNRNGATVTGNSFSSCYDVASSSDELEISQKQNPKSNKIVDEPCTSRTQMANHSKDQMQYRKPQTLISLPFHNYVDENAVLHYRNGNLISGSLDCLITHLVPTHDYAPEMEFEFTFLLCVRLFIKPRELIIRLHQIWAQQQEFTLRTSKAKIAAKLIKVLGYWINTFPYDFRDEILMNEIRTLTKKCTDIDQTLSKEISMVLQHLVESLSHFNKFEETLESYSKPALRHSLDELDKSTTDSDSKYSLMRSESQPISWQLKKASNCFTNGTAKVQALSVMSMCAKHTDLAHQLTAIELDYLSYIGAEELLHAFSPEFQQYMVKKLRNNEKHISFEEKDFEENSGEDSTDETRNLDAYVKWFNRLSYLTATEIVKCYKKKHRVQMIEYWIETARECFNTGNFNSLMAILAGLNLNAVTRLKKTWSKVQSAKFSVLEHQMDPSLNFSSYRSTMKAAVWRSEGSTDDRKNVIIPFFTLFLKDLCILNDSYENRLPNGHINFEKFSYISKQAEDFNKWKQTRCPYQKLPNIITFLQSNEIFNERALLLASFACEAPENGEEKERYKLLRSATN